MSEGFAFLKAPVVRLALPDTPAPMSAPLEQAYYPRAEAIVGAVMESLNCPGN